MQSSESISRREIYIECGSMIILRILHFSPHVCLQMFAQRKVWKRTFPSGNLIQRRWNCLWGGGGMWVRWLMFHCHASALFGFAVFMFIDVLYVGVLRFLNTFLAGQGLPRSEPSNSKRHKGPSKTVTPPLSGLAPQGAVFLCLHYPRARCRASRPTCTASTCRNDNSPAYLRGTCQDPQWRPQIVSSPLYTVFLFYAYIPMITLNL